MMSHMWADNKTGESKVKADSASPAFKDTRISNMSPGIYRSSKSCLPILTAFMSLGE